MANYMSIPAGAKVLPRVRGGRGKKDQWLLSLLEDDWDGMFTKLEMNKMMTAMNAPKTKKSKLDGKDFSTMTRNERNRYNIAKRKEEKKKGPDVDWGHYNNEDWFKKVAKKAGRNMNEMSDFKGMLKYMFEANRKGRGPKDPGKDPFPGDGGPGKGGPAYGEQWNGYDPLGPQNFPEAGPKDPNNVAGSEDYRGANPQWIIDLLGEISGGGGGINSPYVQQRNMGWAPTGGW